MVPVPRIFYGIQGVSTPTLPETLGASHYSPLLRRHPRIPRIIPATFVGPRQTSSGNALRTLSHGTLVLLPFLP